jgi:hypothetical protein
MDPCIHENDPRTCAFCNGTVRPERKRDMVGGWNEPDVARSGEEWTGDEDGRLKRELDNGTPIDEISRMLERSPDAIRNRRYLKGF